MTRYTELCKRKILQQPKFDASDLAQQFINAYNNGDRYRVLVDFGYNVDEPPIWGYIGVTTGYKPVFLLMRRRGQHGSSEVLRQNHKIVASKWIK